MSEKEVRAGLPRSLRAYIVLVAVGGMVWLTYLAQSVEWGPSVLGEMGFFVALIVLAGSFPLPVGPRVKTDVAATALFAAALLLEPGAAALAGAVGVVTYTLLLRFWGQKIRVPWYKYPFNAGATALCVGMASALFHELAAGEGLLSTAVVPAACVYYLVNTGLVSGAAGLQLGVSPLRFWWKGTKDNGIAELSLFAFAFLGAVIYNESPWTVAVLFMPVAIIYIAFSRLAQKIQERELAEEALQKAKEELEIRVEMRTNELTKATEQLAHSRRRVVNSQEDLRKAVAQQLHGPVQNRLLVATHWLRTAQDKIGDGTGETAEQISKAAHLIDEINQGDLSAAVRRLHPSLIRMSLEASLRSLAAEFDGSFDVQVQLSGGTSSRDELWRTGLPEDLRLAIYRVAGAALSNVLKHASATKAELRLDLASEEMVKVTIVDNGCGFDAKTTTPGFGILSMQDHCGAVGGSLQIESIAGEGTAMIASFPLPKRRMAADAPSLPHFIDETVPILSSNGNGNGNGKGAVDHVHPADWIKEGVTTLLVVDDQPDFCELIKDLLKPYEEFQILACSHDGLTALKMVEELQPDVVLLDIEMPALHELDTGNIIHSRFPTVKVVLMSAHHQRESMTDAIPSAAVDFIGKAEFSVNRLLQACRKERAPEAVTSATTSSPGLD